MNLKRGYLNFSLLHKSSFIEYFYFLIVGCNQSIKLSIGTLIISVVCTETKYCLLKNAFSTINEWFNDIERHLQTYCWLEKHMYLRTQVEARGVYVPSL